MKKIFVVAYGEPDWVLGYAIAEDGTCIASHCSSHRGWTRHDMGVEGSDRKHDSYKEKYPDGYELINLIDLTDPKVNTGFAAAYELNQKLKKEDAAAPEVAS